MCHLLHTNKFNLTLATLCKELTHWKRPWCWERLKTEGEGVDRWDGFMASLTQWTWVWANSRRWWRTEKSGMLQSMEVTKSWTQLSDWTTTKFSLQDTNIAPRVHAFKKFIVQCVRVWGGGGERRGWSSNRRNSNCTLCSDTNVYNEVSQIWDWLIVVVQIVCKLFPRTEKRFQTKEITVTKQKCQLLHVLGNTYCSTIKSTEGHAG